MNPEIVDMIAQLAAVNAVLMIVLAVLSYATSAFMLELLTWIDRWMDPSRKHRDDAAAITAPPTD